MTNGPTQQLADPVFIIGVQRSGTTLLRLILDAHPSFAVGPETGFMRAVGFIKSIPDFHGGDRWYQSFGFDDEDFERHIERFHRGIFSEFALRQDKHRWVEKTPFHRFYVKDIARIFPDASFIGVIRHPGAVAASRKKWGYDVLPVLEDWVTSTNRLLSECADLGQKKCHLLRYEDLVSTPQPVLENLLSFLDEPWSNAVLEHHAVQEAKGVDDVTTGGTRSGDAIDATRVDGWLAGLAPDEIELVRDTDRALMERCGYRSETALKRLPFNPESPLSAG